MGLFDGAADGTGSAADLAALLGLPVVLVVDAARQSHSIAALVQGFRQFRSDVDVAGVILNRVGSVRHEKLLRQSLEPFDMPVFGAVRRDAELQLPSRHLGLVQAEERPDLEAFVAHAALTVETSVDIERLLALRGTEVPNTDIVLTLPPLGQHMAVAQDAAFSFLYPHLVDGWRAQGATVSFFSPLADGSPAGDADAVVLPGGYPELHGGRIAAAQTFLVGLRAAASRGALVYGECGGYMVLGDALIDGQGNRHKMAGLLRLVTSFQHPSLTLGYRVLTPTNQSAASFWSMPLSGHEFHYTTAVEERGLPLFTATDAAGETRGACGLTEGTVCGSYMHAIDRR